MLTESVLIPVFLLQSCLEEISGEVVEGDDGEECYSCVLLEERTEEESFNCSQLLLSSHCQYCNTTLECQSGLCKHINNIQVRSIIYLALPPLNHHKQGESGLLPDNVLGLCYKPALRTVFPKDPLGRIISFGLLGIVLSVMSFIFLR